MPRVAGHPALSSPRHVTDGLGRTQPERLSADLFGSVTGIVGSSPAQGPGGFADVVRTRAASEPSSAVGWRSRTPLGGAGRVSRIVVGLDAAVPGGARRG